jgi:hypothetical protein
MLGELEGERVDMNKDVEEGGRELYRQRERDKVRPGVYKKGKWWAVFFSPLSALLVIVSEGEDSELGDGYTRVSLMLRVG